MPLGLLACPARSQLLPKVRKFSFRQSHVRNREKTPMNDQFPPPGWFMQQLETWPNLIPDALTGVPTKAEDPRAPRTRSLVRSNGGILGSLVQPSSGGILGPMGLAVDPWADLPARDSVGWNSRTRPSSTELSLPSPGSLGSPNAGMMAAGNDDYCKRIRNMCIARCSDTSLPSHAKLRLSNCQGLGKSRFRSRRCPEKRRRRSSTS